MIFGIDAGHEGVGNGLDCGAVGNGYYEANITLAVAMRLKQLLEMYKDTKVVMTREMAKQNTLSQKSSFLNKHNIDFVLSIHCNAGGGTGAEIFVYKNGSKAETYAAKILSAYVSKTGLRNRGIKAANYHMLRETKAPASLIELFFIDTLADTNKMANNIELMAKALEEGFVNAFNLQKKATTSANTNSNAENGVWRVVVGSYKDKTNAEKQLNTAKAKGFNNAFMVYQKI